MLTGFASPGMTGQVSRVLTTRLRLCLAVPGGVGPCHAQAWWMPAGGQGKSLLGMEHGAPKMNDLRSGSDVTSNSSLPLPTLTHIPDLILPTKPPERSCGSQMNSNRHDR